LPIPLAVTVARRSTGLVQGLKVLTIPFHQRLSRRSVSSPPRPQVPQDDNPDIRRVEAHHSARFGERETPVVQRPYEDEDRDEEECDVADEGCSRYVEWANQSNGPDHDGDDCGFSRVDRRIGSGVVWGPRAKDAIEDGRE
jgi:hypothetical protein